MKVHHRGIAPSAHLNYLQNGPFCDRPLTANTTL
jgi:hypothetical protein